MIPPPGAVITARTHDADDVEAVSAPFSPNTKVPERSSAGLRVEPALNPASVWHRSRAR